MRRTRNVGSENASLTFFPTAFAQGKAPSVSIENVCSLHDNKLIRLQNKQIDVAMNTALEWRGLNKPSSKLSPEGRQLVADVKDVVEKAKVLLLTKNQGNLIQDFIYQTQHIDQGGAHSVNAPVNKETAKQQGQEALEGLRTLGELIITNGQFRKLRKYIT